MRRWYNVWVGGEFFGAVWASSKPAVVWFVATVVSQPAMSSAARDLLVKPR
jgi:hypothetical protein